MASKLFSRLGGKHKKFVPPPPQADYPIQKEEQEAQEAINSQLAQIQIEEEFSVPLDNDIDDTDVYCDPDPVDSNPDQPSLLVISLTADAAEAQLQPGKVDSGSANDYYSAPAMEDLQHLKDAATPTAMSEEDKAVRDQISLKTTETVSARDHLPAVVNPDSKEQAADDTQVLSNNSQSSTAEITSSEPAADAEQPTDMATSIYMNETSAFYHKEPTNQIITPDIDPRNFTEGNEYECPWDFKNAETEIYEMVKSAQPKLKPLNTQHLVKMDYTASTPTPIRETSTISPKHSPQHHSPSQKGLHSYKPEQAAVKSSARRPSGSSQRSATDSSSGERKRMTGHRVGNLSVRRQSGTNSGGKSSGTAVLVEGEWREAKHIPRGYNTPPSPELRSSPNVVSQANRSPTGSEGNAASNRTYVDSNDEELSLHLRYADDKGKTPRAAPRSTLLKGEDPAALYENTLDAQKMAKTSPPSAAFPVVAAAVETDPGDLYEAPWNSEQVQQQFLERLHHQPSTNSTGSTARSKHTNKSSSQTTHHRPECAANHPHSCKESHGAKLDKLSPRALTDTHIHKPNTVPCLPPNGPPKSSHHSPVSTSGSVCRHGHNVSHSTQGHGTAHSQSHTTGHNHSWSMQRSDSTSSQGSKPVLVVTQNATSGGETKRTLGGSRKKFVETTYLTTRNHTFHVSGKTLTGESSSSVTSSDWQPRIGLPVDKTLPLSKQPWYHGSIPRNHAEEMLRSQPDGSFLIRDSAMGTDKSLSLKNGYGFIHIKIQRQTDGKYVLGQFSPPFKSIPEMVEYYSKHKVNIKGAEHTHLEIPVMKMM